MSTTETNSRHHDIAGVCGTTKGHEHGVSVCSLNYGHAGSHRDVTYGYFREGR